MTAVRPFRLPLVVLVIAVSTACASTGRHAPRPFPTAPTPAFPGSPTPSGRSLVTTDVLSTALDLLGTPYRLGGSDASGFDCSGFVQFVLARHAVSVPRTVVQQFAVGDPARGVEAGDLVFFRTAGRRASHVGIAVDGESFVHAPSSRGVVRIERLDAPYWSARFLGARRVF
ncbi:MAG: C40 family peptidase [Acidobacteria bacterium]|nr:C40 family peptidase [Acidobacteriota bacterium]